jgi:hypothetical protein
MASRAAAKSRPIYDVHPGVVMVQKWVGELKDKTGARLRSGWHCFRKKARRTRRAGGSG